MLEVPLCRWCAAEHGYRLHRFSSDADAQRECRSCGALTGRVSSVTCHVHVEPHGSGWRAVAVLPWATERSGQYRSRSAADADARAVYPGCRVSVAA